MKVGTNKQSGFTIVEMIIVVVIIAILATITIVAYSAVRNHAIESQVKAELSQANQLLSLYASKHAGRYPAELTEAGIENSDGVAFQYTADGDEYALTASNGVMGSTTYHVSSSQKVITEGIAEGHNIMPWDETDAASKPIDSGDAVIDTSEYFSAPASIRLPPGATGRELRLKPVEGEIGQRVRLTAQLKTAADWNGTSGNSKIRIGTYPSGGLLKACSYAGVKLDWTEVTCYYDLTATNPSIRMYFGNDGTVGDIWIDDIVVSLETL